MATITSWGHGPFVTRLLLINGNRFGFKGTGDPYWHATANPKPSMLYSAYSFWEEWFSERIYFTCLASDYTGLDVWHIIISNNYFWVVIIQGLPWNIYYCRTVKTLIVHHIIIGRCFIMAEHVGTLSQILPSCSCQTLQQHFFQLTAHTQ